MIDARTVRVLFTTLLFLAVAAVVYLGRRIFLTLVLSLLFAYVLDPIVGRVQRSFGGSRTLAIAFIYVAGIALLVAALMGVAPRVRDDGVHAAAALPALAEQIGSGNIVWNVGTSRGWSDKTRAEAAAFLSSHRSEIIGAMRAIAARAAELGSHIGYLILIPIFTLFFLKDKSCVSDLTVNALARDRRDLARRIFDDLDRMLAQYIRAQLIMAGLAVLAYTIVLSLTHFPYPLALGALCGVLEFIPFVGPAVSAVGLIVIGAFTGYPHWVILLVFLAVWRILQDYVNTPYFMGEGLDLHPLVTIVGVLVGGEVFGIPGMFLSIPAIAALRIVWREWTADEDAARV